MHNTYKIDGVLSDSFVRTDSSSLFSYPWGPLRVDKVVITHPVPPVDLKDQSVIFLVQLQFKCTKPEQPLQERLILLFLLLLAFNHLLSYDPDIKLGLLFSTSSPSNEPNAPECTVVLCPVLRAKCLIIDIH